MTAAACSVGCAWCAEETRGRHTGDCCGGRICNVRAEYRYKSEQQQVMSVLERVAMLAALFQAEKAHREYIKAQAAEQHAEEAALKRKQQKERAQSRTKVQAREAQVEARRAEKEAAKKAKVKVVNVPAPPKKQAATTKVEQKARS